MIKNLIKSYQDFRYRYCFTKKQCETFSASLFTKIWFSDRFLNLNPLDANLPWMPYTAILLLDDLIKDDYNILETGSGGSSIFFATRCKRLITLEHDKDWVNIVRKHKLFKRKGTNWSIIQKDLSAPNDNQYSPYLEYLKSQKENFFDLISIDGRIRNQSLKIVAQKVKKGGHLLLDNSNREEYSDGINFIDMLGWHRKELNGFCYGYEWDSLSTIWHKV